MSAFGPRERLERPAVDSWELQRICPHLPIWAAGFAAVAGTARTRPSAVLVFVAGDGQPVALDATAAVTEGALLSLFAVGTLKELGDLVQDRRQDFVAHLAGAAVAAAMAAGPLDLEPFGFDTEARRVAPSTLRLVRS